MNHQQPEGSRSSRTPTPNHWCQNHWCQQQWPDEAGDGSRSSVPTIRYDSLTILVITSLLLVFFNLPVPAMGRSPSDAASSTTTKVVSSSSNRLDPTASISTRIHVSQQRVRITLEEFSDDLVWLHGMEADENGLFSAEQLREFYELHQKFLAERLDLIRADGSRLKPVLVDQGPYPFDDELVKNGATEFHLVKRKMSFTYEYDSDQPLDLLTIRHRIVDDNFLYPAELSIEMFQGSSDLSIKSKLRVDTPVTIQFDWEHPIPGLSASQDEIRDWLQAQQDRMLGVTEFGAVYCWGYLEPRRLRVELLFPLNVLETMFELPSRDPDFLEADELDVATQRITSYFQTGNPVLVEGQPVTPQVTKVDYFPADQRDFAVRTQVQRLHFANGRVGITIHYPYDDAPDSVELRWDKFSRALNTVLAYLYFEDQVVSETFSRQTSDNRIVWKNPGSWKAPQPVVPVKASDSQWHQETGRRWWIFGMTVAPAFLLVFSTLRILRPDRSGPLRWLGSLVVAGLIAGVAANQWPQPFPTVSQESGQPIAEKTLENVYHAFQFADETEVYDQLAESVAGGELRELYLQLLKGLTAEEQGGAVSTIESVSVTDVQMLPETAMNREQLQTLLSEPAEISAAFQCRLTWDLQGLVEHWGHSHQRTNRYVARATFAAIDSQWKLLQLVVESQDPGLTKPRPGRFRRSESQP